MRIDYDHLPFFDEYPENYFLLLAITDVNMKQYPFYFKGVFKNLHTGKFEFVDNIRPSALKNRYIVGNIYRAGMHISQCLYIKHGFFTVNKDSHKPLVPLSQVISESGVIFDIDQNYAKESSIDPSVDEDEKAYNDFIKQYAHIEEGDNYVLIIPCYLIALEFYLLSSKVNIALMNGMLSSLYYEEELRFEIDNDETVTAHIVLKEDIAKSSIDHIVRFASNSYNRNRFNYIVSSKKSLESYQSIRAKFPISSPFEIDIDYIKSGQYIRGRPIYFALCINRNYAPFEFDETIYRFMKR